MRKKQFAEKENKNGNFLYYLLFYLEESTFPHLFLVYILEAHIYHPNQQKWQ